MSEEYKRNLGISVSSTNVPTIQMQEDRLKFCFVNWDYEEVELEFESALAFRWHSHCCPDHLHDDAAFEVLKSEWLKELLTSEQMVPKTRAQYHHYQFCVYGCWLFEVVAQELGLTIKESEETQESWAECTF